MKKPISWLKIPSSFPHRCIYGFLFSVCFIWIVSFFLKSSPVVYGYDHALDSWLPKPGHVLETKEGYGITRINEHGLIGELPPSSGKQIMLLWGDSYVEAFQVNDNLKTNAILNRLFLKNNEDMVCYAKGLSRDNLASYILNIPLYEKLYPIIKTHVIILTDLQDILPDNENDTSATLKADGNTYSLEKTGWKPSFQKIKGTLYALSNHFSWNILKTLGNDLSLRFSLGKASPSARESSPNAIPLIKTAMYQFWCDSLRKATNREIIILYAPMVPMIENNKITYLDKYKDQFDRFKTECQANSIVFLNLENQFIKAFKKSGRFPRGFVNSRPGRGHFNPQGHALIATSLYRFYKSNSK